MPAWLTIAAQLQLVGPPAVVIGTLDGDSISALHNVAGIEEDRRGNVYLIQRRAPCVLVFDSAGRSVAVLGRRIGSGQVMTVPELPPLAVPAAMWDSITDSFVATLGFASTSASRASLKRDPSESFPRPERSTHYARAEGARRQGVLEAAALQ